MRGGELVVRLVVVAGLAIWGAQHGQIGNRIYVETLRFNRRCLPVPPDRPQKCVSRRLGKPAAVWWWQFR